MIEQLAVIPKRLKSMSKAVWDIKGTTIFRGEDYRGMLAKRG